MLRLLQELNEANGEKRLEWGLERSTGVVCRDDFSVIGQVDLRGEEMTLIVNYVTDVLSTHVLNAQTLGQFHSSKVSSAEKPCNLLVAHGHTQSNSAILQVAGFSTIPPHR